MKVKTVNEVIGEIIEASKNIVLNESGSHYVDKKTGKKYERVTTHISKVEGKKKEITPGPELEMSQVLGTAVDEFVRDFFEGNLKDFSSYGYADPLLYAGLLSKLRELKKEFDERGETVIPREVLVYNDTAGVAGTLDLLTYDREGNFRIYDMKTKKGGFTYVDATNFGKSSREQWTDQTSMYRILLNNTFGINAIETNIILIGTSYSAKQGDTETSVLELLGTIKLQHKNEVAGVKFDESKTAEIVPDIPSENEVPTKLPGSIDSNIIKKRRRGKEKATKEHVPTHNLTQETADSVLDELLGKGTLNDVSTLGNSLTPDGTKKARKDNKDNNLNIEC